MMTVPQTLAQFNRLKDAEDYFAFFGLSYDPQVVNVNRLHILRKFSQLTAAVDATQAEPKVLTAYCEALQAAYEVFLSSTGVEQKLFKVFNDKPSNVVMVSDISAE